MIDEKTPVGKLIAALGRLGSRPEGAQQRGGEHTTASTTNGLPHAPGWTKGGNPFVNPEKEWHSRYYDLAKAKRNWQIVAALSVVTCLALVGAYVNLSLSSRVVPYVVNVDSLGVPLAFGALEAAGPNELVVRASISTFLMNVRRIVADPIAQKDAIETAYRYVDAKGQTFLNAYFSRPENDPLALGQKIRREVHIESLLKIPGSDSYRVKWVERERGFNSRQVTRTAWEGIFVVSQLPPERLDAQTIVNPLGIYITDINWGAITPRG